MIFCILKMTEQSLEPEGFIHARWARNPGFLAHRYPDSESSQAAVSASMLLA